jgi:hypothetical protein
MGLIERLFGRRRKAADLAVQDDHLLLRPARSRFRTVITIAVATSTDRTGRSTQQIAPYDRPSEMVVQPKRGNVATAEQVKEWQALRGRVLNALWDSENNDGIGTTLVSALLMAIGDPDLSPEQTERLFRQLSYDGLITDPGFGSVECGATRLTTEGRYEVEKWLTEQRTTTEHIKVPANQVFNIIGSVNSNGPVLQGSTATSITTNYGVSSDALVKVVAQFREILTTANLSDDDREAIEVDVDVLEEETQAVQPKPKRLRALLLRLGAALTTGALAGIQAGTKQETLQAIEMAQKGLGIG